MEMPNTVKENPFKTILAIIVLLGGIVSGTWAADDRWNQTDLETDFVQFKTEQGKNFSNFRLQHLEDKIFELEFKKNQGKASSLDKAILDRSKREARQLRNKLK